MGPSRRGARAERELTLLCSALRSTRAKTGAPQVLVAEVISAPQSPWQNPFAESAQSAANSSTTSSSSTSATPFVFSGRCRILQQGSAASLPRQGLAAGPAGHGTLARCRDNPDRCPRRVASLVRTPRRVVPSHGSRLIVEITSRPRRRGSFAPKPPFARYSPLKPHLSLPPQTVSRPSTPYGLKMARPEPRDRLLRRDNRPMQSGSSPLTIKAIPPIW
jgi:hypothetical protein